MEYKYLAQDNLAETDLKTQQHSLFFQKPQPSSYIHCDQVLAGCRREIFQPTFALFCPIFAPLKWLLEQIQPNYRTKTEHFGSRIALSDKLLAPRHRIRRLPRWFSRGQCTQSRSRGDHFSRKDMVMFCGRGG